MKNIKRAYYTPLAITLNDGRSSNDVYLDAFIDDNSNIIAGYNYNSLNYSTDFERIDAIFDKNANNWYIEYSNEGQI